MALINAEIGPRMRKDDPVSFKELLVEIISKTNEVREEASSMKKWVVYHYHHHNRCLTETL